MFGLIISGRPVDATPQAFTETQYTFRIQPNPSFNHIVVFLLPTTQLPAGFAAAVHIKLLPSQEYKLLGGIGPGKESAIFKVSGQKDASVSSAAAAVDGDVMVDEGVTVGGAAALPDYIMVGISIEPAAQVEAQLAQLKTGSNAQSQTAPSSALVRMTSSTGGRDSTKVLAQRIIGNAFNFLASFGSDTVPLKAFQDWWAKFEKKIELDPSFLDRTD